MDDLLERLSETVSKARTVEDVTRPFLAILGSLTGMESTYLTRIDVTINEQEIQYAMNSSQLQMPEGLSVPWCDTLCKRAIESGQWFTPDVPACWPDSQAARALGIQAYLSTPVRLPDGSLYGTLCAASSKKLNLDDSVLKLLPLLAGLIAQYVEREQFLQRLVLLSQRLAADSGQDVLTGLPNRRTLSHELTRLLELGHRDSFHVLVSFVDLDGFKGINDRYGHPVGDAFLKSVANRLTMGMRTADITARIGGDEFIIVGAGPHVGNDVLAAIDNFEQRAQRAIAGIYQFDDVLIDYAGASIGTIAVAPGQMSEQEAIEQADQLMYNSKKIRKATMAVG